jgi:NAD(P)-dependent dehydrogenase (short-subunit alcohol dehydrogenase family)
MYNFKGKVAIVTGGASGIGKAAVLKFAECGAAVAIFDIDKSKAGDVILELEKKSVDYLFVTCDVANEESVEAAVDTVINKYGRLDFAYNNAGISGEFAKIENYPTADWDKVMSVNLTGVFLCMKHEIPHILKQGGAIVNCASLLSTVCYENDSAYVASKFGVLGLTKNAALEYANTGLRINAISPGFTYTPMILKGSAEKVKELENKHPAGRLAKPEEIAEAVMWLCSDASSFAIGLNLMMDGGYTLI